MTYFSHFSLQIAIFSLLNADDTLMQQVSGIYDFVPDDAAYPFITLGENNVSDWSNAENQGTQHQFSLRIFSRNSGRKEAANIMEQLVMLLHQGVSISGHELAFLRVISSNIILLDDGRTYRGTLNFRCLLSGS